MTRRGSALPAALGLLLALSLVTAAALEFANSSLESGRRRLTDARLRAAGHSALARAMSGPLADTAVALPTGSVIGVDSTARAGIVAVDSLLRLSPAIYRLFATALESRPGRGLVARHATRQLMQLIGVEPDDTAAVVAAGPVMVEDQGTIDGAGATGVLAGLLSPIWVDSLTGAVVRGTPPLARDTGVTPALLDRSLPSPFAVLAGAADHRLALTAVTPGPSVTAGGCTVADPLNWGDPTGAALPCTGFWPMVLLPAGAIVRDGVGQGILLASGDLRLAGGFRFEGIILARGAVVVEDSTVVLGRLVAMDSVVVRGGASVTGSVPAVGAAQAAVRWLRPLPSRGWSRGP